MAVGLDRERQAGRADRAVEQDGAGAADAVLAAEMRAGQAEVVAEEVRQRDADRRPPCVCGVPLTVTVMVRLSDMRGVTLSPRRRWTATPTGKFQAKRPGGPHVEHQLEFGRLHHWQIGRLLALEDAGGVNAHLTV